MTDTHDRPSSDDQPLDQVLAEFIRRRDAGQPVDVESLCAARPDLADALRSYADGEDLIREMALDDSVAGGSALAETIRPGAGRDTDAAMTGRVFGNYRVIRQLGQGGMGAVYLAEDLTLQRQVALKIPKFRHSDGPDARERFFREARAAAALNHPHICPVFHADEVDGTPYIAMAFIDGQPLSRFVGTDEFHDSRRVVEVVRAVADALQHAHDQGVIHRDLKPGNIMLDHSGRPIVTDFGLARRIVADQESRITQEGQLLGTPAYMSPEQIAGNPDQVSSSTDIYALGVVLFELLTSRLPFQGSVPEVIAGALKSEPPKPTSLRADVDPVLESLCLQMLQKKAERRPASMQDVSQRLQKWLDQTTPESSAEQAATKKLRKELAAERDRVEKLLRAGKFEAALKRLHALARRKEPAANEFREWAIDQIPRVKARPAQAKRNEPEMLQMAQDWMAKHDYQQAIQILQSIPDLYRSETAEELLLEATELQEEADDLLLDLKKCVKDRIYDGIDDNLNRLLVLKPGNQFAKNLQRKLQSYRGGRGKGRPYRFDKQGRLLAINEDSFWSRAMILSAVVGISVFGLMTWAITIYLRNGDQEIAVEIDSDWLQEQGGELTLDVDGDEHTLTASGLDLKVSLGKHGFSVRQGDTVVHNPQQFSIEKEGRKILKIDATGMRLNTLVRPLEATGAGTAEPVAVDAPQTPLPDGPPELLKSLDGHKGAISQVAWSSDGRTLASVSAIDGTLRIWDVATGSERQKFRSAFGYSVAIHPNGKLVAAPSPWAPGRLAFDIYDVESGKKVGETPAVGKPVLAAMFSPDGNYLAIHCRENAGIKVYDVSGLPDVRLAAELPGSDSGWKVSLAFLPDSRQLLASSSGKQYGLKLFDIATQSQIRSYHERNGDEGSNNMDSIAVHPNGQQFHIVSDSTWWLMQRSVTDEAIATPIEKEFRKVVYSPSGEFLIGLTRTEAGNRYVIARSNQTGSTVWQEEITQITPTTLAVSPDGRFVVIGGEIYDEKNELLRENPCPLLIWRLPKEVWPKLKAASGSNVQADGGQSPPYLTDSRTTVTAPESPLTDGPPGLAMTLKGHTDEILEIVPSLDGRYLVSCSRDRTTKVWDLQTGKAIRELPLEPPVYRLRFDGNDLIMGGPVGRLKRHRFSDGQLLLAYRGYPEDEKGGSRSVGSIQPGHEPGTFVTCNFRGDVAVWKYGDAQPVQQFTTEKVFQNAYPVPEGYLLSGFGTKQARLVDRDGKTIREMFSRDSGGPVSVAPDGRVFISHHDGGIGETSLQSGEVSKSYSTGWVRWTQFSPDGRHVLCEHHDNILLILDRSTGQEVYRAILPLMASWQAISSDGRYLFLATEIADTKMADTRVIYVWRLPQEDRER